MIITTLHTMMSIKCNDMGMHFPEVLIRLCNN
jgi:hypothetical protein